MICNTCRTAAKLGHDGELIAAAEMHGRCKGSTWCDCQHRKTKRMPDGRLAQISDKTEGRLPG